MTKKQALKWTAALRSGKYKQTQAFLQNERGHCCLGVACELFDKNVQRNSDGTLYGVTLATQSYTYNILNIGTTGRIDEDMSLAGLNDQGYTFDEIADIIELKWVHGAL